MDPLPSRFTGIDILPEKPFSNDKLGYSQYASTLTGMVDMYAGTGCVIAVNGKWGSGKTTFLKMWSTSLPADKYKTIYFNAWETDYFTDPLIAILGELSEIAEDNEQKKTFINSAGKIASAVGGALLKGLARKFTGIDDEVIDDTVDELKASLGNSLDIYKGQKQSLTEFRKKLSEFVASQDHKSVVFMIDELDRCNPDYAVRLLETVKHLFEVPNICFILAVDKQQLECSIKGFYGSNEIDAGNYLRRFIDIEFRMPDPNLEKFASVLFDHYNYQPMIEAMTQSIFNSKEEFCEMATAFGSLYFMDLRSFDKVFAHARLALIQLNNDSILLKTVLFLCFIRVGDPAFYEALERRRYTIQGLLDEFEKKFPQKFLKKDNYGSSTGRLAHSIIYIIGPILMMYNIVDGAVVESGLNDWDKSKPFPLSCHVIDNETLKDSVNWFSQHGSRSYGLSNVFKTVNLLRQFN